MTGRTVAGSPAHRAKMRAKSLAYWTPERRDMASRRAKLEAELRRIADGRA